MALALGSASCAVGDAPVEAQAPATEPAAVTPDAEPTETQTPEEEPTPEPEVSISYTGWVESEGGEYSYGVVILDNPNEGMGYEAGQFEISALDKDGTILDTTQEYGTVLPGQQFALHAMFEADASEIVDLEVRGPMSMDDLSDAGTIEVSDVEVTHDEWSSRITGTLSGNFAEDLESVRVIAVVRNGTDLVAVEWTYVDRLKSGGKSKFTIDTFDKPAFDAGQVDIFTLL
ncbi:hypothetical protein [Isoptericola variabilis]|nr:hypothetical protein [Isoptericola variabilis]